MSDYTIETIEKDNLRLTISYDTDAMNPREDDCGLGSRMVCFHKRYNMPNEENYDYNDYNSWKEFEQQIRKDNDIAILLNVFMYEHSGVSLSTARTCQWDSGQVGFMYITKPMIRQLRNCKYVTKKILEQEEQYLRNQIKIYGKYMNGDVYGFQLEEIEVKSYKKVYSNGEESEDIEEKEYNEIDSCWGFYSKQDMKDNVHEKYHYLFDELSNI